MRYYKQTINGYIASVGIGFGCTEITEEEYAEIILAIYAKPAVTEDIDYRLKENLTWEPYELELVELEPTEEDYATVGHILIGEAI